VTRVILTGILGVAVLQADVLLRRGPNSVFAAELYWLPVLAVVAYLASLAMAFWRKEPPLAIHAAGAGGVVVVVLITSPRTVSGSALALSIELTGVGCLGIATLWVAWSQHARRAAVVLAVGGVLGALGLLRAVMYRYISYHSTLADFSGTVAFAREWTWTFGVAAFCTIVGAVQGRTLPGRRGAAA
jgi:hypothetical protein